VTLLGSPFRRWLLAAALAVAGWTSVLIIDPDSTRSQWLSNLGLIGAAWFGAAGCFARSRRGDRAPWLLIGAGSFSWGAGQAAWTWYESVQGREVPFPSLADAGYLLAPVLLVIGLLRLPSGPAGLAGRVRLLLDGLLVGLSLMVLSWAVVLQDTVRAGGDTPLLTSISVSYPAADVVVGTIAVVALLRARHGAGMSVPVLGLLLAGTAASALADSGFAYLALHGQYYSGHPIDIGWFAGWLLLGLASRWPQQRSQPVVEGTRTHGVGLFAPYMAVGVAVVVDVAREVVDGYLGKVTAWSTIILVVLLSVRQVLVLQENSGLTSSLEARVEERTAELAGRELWFRSLVQDINDVITVVDANGIASYQTPSAQLHFGRPPESLLGAGLLAWWSPLDAGRLQHVFDELSDSAGVTRLFTGDVLHADGHAVPVEMTVTSVRDAEGRQNGFVLNARDITERRAFEQELSHQAFHDALTGLANRGLFRDRVEHALMTRSRSARPLAVLFLDLDGFKAVNDTLGHGMGDVLLRQVAGLLLGAVRPGDTVARLGGDEFAVLLEELSTDDEAAAVAVRIQEALLDPLDVEGHRVLTRASTGIAVFHGDEDAEVLLRNADLAMYRAKESGLGSFAVYEDHMHEGLVARLQLEADLREALSKGELRVVYQPTMSLANGSWHSCEALLRWDHPTRGLVPPVDFIPIAERTGLIVSIGAWVLAEACRQTADWRTRFPEAAGLGVAVNVSVRQLQASGFLRTVDEALETAGLPPHMLTIELTESILVEHTDEILRLLEDLKERGVRLAIDDFGTGYSSLSYLHRFPIDVLKVDRSFISSLSHGDDELTRTIVNLGQSLGLMTVAEGIEENDQLTALQAMGCTLGQGFLLARPERPDVVEALLALPTAALPNAG
jgi:diguanylate cyclase (GGDEF)-like protein/PAS domain S-box-containing protein